MPIIIGDEQLLDYFRYFINKTIIKTLNSTLHVISDETILIAIANHTKCT